MVDALTPNYYLTQPTVGGDTGTWGGILNNNTISPVDSALGATQAVTITSADVTLTTAQFQSAIFNITGTLTGNRNLIIPLSTTAGSSAIACGGRFIVLNNSSGAFNINVKTASSNSGAGVVIPQGGNAFLYSDGSNVGYANLGLPSYATAVSGSPNGQIPGTAGSVNTNVQLAFDYVNNNLYACTTTGSSSTATWAQPTVTVPRGFDTAVNLRLVASVNANILTVAVKTADTNADPSATDPVIVNFANATLANGDPVTVNITSALSINTNAVGASLGSSNGVPFRFWIVIFNNGGSPILGLINCSTSAAIFPLNEFGVASSVQMTAGATVAGTFYTPNGTTVSNCAFKIIGFLSYDSGLVTAGTYNTPPTAVRLFGPGIKKPGDVVQTSWQNGSSVATIAPSSPTSLVKIYSSTTITFGAAGAGACAYQIVLKRGATSLDSKVPRFDSQGAGRASGFPTSFNYFDQPASTAVQTYSLSSGSSGNLNLAAGTGTLTTAPEWIFDEIMG